MEWRISIESCLSGTTDVLDIKGLILSYHRCFIWLKSVCRVCYSYTRQSDVRGKHCEKANARHFFSRLKTLAGEWRCLAAYIIVVVLSNEFERAILTIIYLP